MTCIVGLECSDGAVIAGDFCGSNGFTYQTVVPPKVFEHSQMKFGYTSTFRFGQIIEHVLDDNTLYPPTEPEQTYRWLVKTFVPKIRAVFKDEEYKLNDGCNAVLVVNGQVWELQNDLSVLRNEAGLCVVGSGTYHTEASILTQLITNHKTSRPTMDEAEKIIELAYNVTSSFVTSVSSKVKVIKDS